ncbi:MAG: hypothetical protein D6705_09790 [Deltaproteobacteria bacterium]|nr:MAG: hypothetical protein D6705_09790 [Deltaproteobacteria bacterium]
MDGLAFFRMHDGWLRVGALAMVLVTGCGDDEGACDTEGDGCGDTSGGSSTGPDTSGTASTGVGGTGPSETYYSLRVGPADGGEEIESLVALPGGGAVAAGFADGFGDPEGDGWIVEFDPSGSVTYQAAIGASGPDMITDLRPLDGGGFVGTGWTQAGGGGGYDLWVFRLDADHGVTWSYTYGGPGNEQGWSIVPLAGGDFVVSGGTTSFGAGMADYWVLRLDADGMPVWQQTIGGSDDDCGGGDFEEYVLRANRLASGTIVLTCDSASFGAGDTDVWAVAIDGDGQVTWQNAYGGPFADFSWDADASPDGTLVLSAVTESFSPDDSGDAWVLRIAPDGSVLSENLFGIAGVYDETLTVAATPDGGFFLGNAAYPDGDWRYLLLRADADGGVTWFRDHEQGWSWPNALLPLDDGSLLAAGVYWGGDPSPDEMDLWMLHVDAAGDLSSCDRVSDVQGVTQATTATVTPTNAMPMPTSATPEAYPVTVTETDAPAAAACGP